MYSLEEATRFYKENHFLADSSEMSNEDSVSDKWLNSQVCSVCKNYLSFGPVTNVKNQKLIICARKQCTEKFQSLHISMYNRVAKKLYFRCINYYAGCDVVLPFTGQMKDHEITCEFKKICCLECQFTGNSCQIIQHYKQTHSHLFTEDGIFQLNQKINETNILSLSQHLLIIIKLDIWDNELKILCNALNSNCDIKKYKVKFFNPSIDVYYESKYIEFQTEKYTIDLCAVKKHLQSNILFGVILLQQKRSETCENLKIFYLPRFHQTKNSKALDDSFTKALKDILMILSRMEVYCFNCNNQIINKKDIIICPQSHFSCLNCCNSYCKVCDTECLWTKTNLIFENVSLLCDWKECKKKINCLDFITHKQICSKREYKCPIEDCLFTGSSTDLLNHWHSSLIPLKMGKVLDFTISENYIYWIIDDLQEMLYIKIVKIDGYVYLEVNETMSVFPDNYKLELFYYDENHKFYYKFEDLIQKGSIKTHHHSFHRYNQCRLIVNVNNNSLVPDIPDNTSISESEIATPEFALKKIIAVFFKTLPKCCTCKNLIRNKAEIFLCFHSHVTCKNCLNKCTTCKTDNFEFISLNKLVGNLKFSCDWKGCIEKTSCWNFLQHKQTCMWREYRCPPFNRLMILNEVLNIGEPFLKYGTHLDFEIGNVDQTIYWLTDLFSELLVVEIKCIKPYPKVDVIERNAIMPESYTLNILTYTSSGCYEKPQELRKSGDFKTTKGLYLYFNTKYRLDMQKK